MAVAGLEVVGLEVVGLGALVEHANEALLDLLQQQLHATESLLHNRHNPEPRCTLRKSEACVSKIHWWLCYAAVFLNFSPQPAKQVEQQLLPEPMHMFPFHHNTSSISHSRAVPL